MSDDPHDREGPPDAGGEGSVGSVGEEAAKLFGALSTWARGAGGADLGAMAGAFAGSVAEVNDHVATGAEECRWCPVCRAVHAVRELNPEVRAHLTSAASSLLQAASEALASLPQPGRERPGASGEESGFERIDLDLDPEPDDHPHDGGAT